MRYALIVFALLLAAPAALAQQTFDPRIEAASPAATGASFDYPKLQDGFFTATTYRGAFAPNGERWDLPWANYDAQFTDYGPVAGAIVIEGNINSNTTLTANNRYLLRGFVNVNAPATLTIEPGTVIFGETSSLGTLIINRGAKIDAQGTPTAPIVFTSPQPRGQRQGGDWGGVILAGRASVNLPGGEGTIEGGTGTVFGGGANPNDNDDSGVMRYVRIEFPGVEFSPDNEINGLTMGGVGRGTIIEYVQVSFCDDDSFEWFGGTVDGRYLISYGALDDDFDGDLGWRGRVQFGLIVRDPDLADISGSNAFEQDGAASEPTPPQTPRSAPVFSNVTVMGPLLYASAGNIDPNYRRGAHIRRASRASIFNSIVVGFPTGLQMDGPNVAADAQAGTIELRNNVWTGPFQSNESGFNADAWFRTPSFGNTVIAAPSDALFVSPVVTAEDEAAALRFALDTYPNPASGAVTVAFELERAQEVQVAVFNVLGRRVAVLAEGAMPAGTQRLALDTAVLPSGTYVVRVQGERSAATRMLTVVH